MTLRLGFTEALFDAFAQCKQTLRLLLHQQPPETRSLYVKATNTGSLSLRLLFRLTNLNVAEAAASKERGSPLFGRHAPSSLRSRLLASGRRCSTVGTGYRTGLQIMFTGVSSRPERT